MYMENKKASLEFEIEVAEYALAEIKENLKEYKGDKEDCTKAKFLHFELSYWESRLQELKSEYDKLKVALIIQNIKEI